MAIPDIVPIGQAHILCEQYQYTVLNTGEVINKNQYGQPFAGDALAHALRYHGFDGVVVRTRGDQFRGLSINNPNGNLTNTVQWGNANVSNITVWGDETDKGSRVGNISIFDKTGDVRLENLTLMNDAGATCPVMINQNGKVGKMLFYTLACLPRSPSSWQGKGMKWNFRGNGVVAMYDIRDIELHAALEHGLYLGNRLGSSYIVQVIGGSMGRTLMQLTNREIEGPASQGDLTVFQCVSNGNGGQGGSDFTFVGIGEGTLYFMQNKSFNSKQGSFVHWTDTGHGAYLTPKKFSSTGLVIKDFEVNCPQADRDHMMISGVETVTVTDWDITGNKTAIGLNAPGGGGIKNGKVELATGGAPPSKDSGWKSYKKMKDGNKTLTNAEIDALVSNRG